MYKRNFNFLASLCGGGDWFESSFVGNPEERFSCVAAHIKVIYIGAPGVWGIWREWLLIFRELGSTGNYFQGFGEQAHSLGNLGSPAKKYKKSHLKRKAFILFDFFKKKIFGFWGEPPRPPFISN